MIYLMLMMIIMMTIVSKEEEKEGECYKSEQVYDFYSFLVFFFIQIRGSF